MTARLRIPALAASLLVFAGGVTLADETGDAAPSKPLDAEFVRWLERVGPLISDEEREFFIGLPEDYRREAFIQAFWRPATRIRGRR